MQSATEIKQPLLESRSQTTRAARTVFTMAVFTSAFLLFAIQPMFTKMVLPQLGGSPGVWSVAMVFFQALLLFGYLYAHVSTRYLSTRMAIIVHVCLLLVTFAALPIAITTGLGKPPVEGQIFWLIGVFTFSVGLPFFAVAGNGPLLQAWFARTRHSNANDPYFLYAASNLGSFSALLLYPLLFEPGLRLSQQSTSWSVGFALLALLIGASGFIVQRATAGEVEETVRVKLTQGPNARLIGHYIWLSFIPSALLVAVTAHISTDVAATPFLWIIPLALFLLTFVLIFRDKPLVPMAAVAQLVPVMAGLIFIATIMDFNILVTCVIHLGFFMAAALMCHKRLYDLRPNPEHLTQFYLWMSFGGVLGGIFSGLLAPYIFNRILEYPIIVSLVMLAHPGVRQAARSDIMRQAVPVLGTGLASIAGIYFFRDQEMVKNGLIPFPLVVLSSLAVIGLYKLPLIRAALIPLVFIFLELVYASIFNTTSERSFFGVHQISIRENGQYRVLTHGTTIHGAIQISNADGTPYTGPIEPLTYYHPKGVLAQTLHLLPAQAAGRDIAVVGLGSGAQACNGATGDRWTYFEIDALVAKIATDPKLFSFLSTCAPNAKIILGDARLTIAEQPPAVFDYLLVDAFSSDSIPVHLLTREALALYMSRLKENGLLVIHISNRHMELQSVAAALARDANISMKARMTPFISNSFVDPTPASAVIFAQKPETLAAFTKELGWSEADSHGVAAWTDDYSNVPGAIWRKYAN